MCWVAGLAAGQHDHVGAGAAGASRDHGERQAVGRGLAAQRVGDRHARVAEVVPQERANRLRPAGAVRGVPGRVGRIRQHQHGRAAGGHRVAERIQVLVERRLRRPDDDLVRVGIAGRPADAREVLEDRDHVLRTRPVGKGKGEPADEGVAEPERPPLLVHERCGRVGHVGNRRQVDVDRGRVERGRARGSLLGDEIDAVVDSHLPRTQRRAGPRDPADGPALLVDHDEQAAAGRPRQPRPGASRPPRSAPTSS